MMRAPSRQRGFTLIELVIAFVVFAFAMGALMEINASSLRAARRSAAMTEAALLAKSKLDELGVGIALEEGGESGRFEGTDYSWELEVRKEEAPPTDTGVIEEVPVDLFRLELTVSWREGRTERSAKFATMRAIQPGGSPQ
jgi:general secretion pathway protein I